MNDIQLTRLGFGLMAAAYAGELVQAHINRKRFNHNAEFARQLMNENEELHDALLSSVEQSTYLFAKLCEAGVQPTEFDIIVLNSLT